MKGRINYVDFNDDIAIIDDKNKSYSYGDIYLKINLLKNHLSPGLVFCFCKNTIGSIVGYLTFIENNIVPVMIDVEKDNETIDKLIEIYNPNYLWVPVEISEFYSNRGKNLFTILGYSLIAIHNNDLNLNKDLALLLPTSGSTGSPKLVRLSNKNLISNALSIANYLDITSDERPVTSLPMHYSYGLSVINSHLIKGATILLTEYSVMQKEFWGFTKEYGATSISGVPYTYEMLKRLRVFRMDLRDLKTFTQAGGKLNAKLVKEYVEESIQHKKQFIVMYGQTEATARMSYLPFDRAKDKNDSIGIAIPGGSFKLVDKGNEVEEPDIDGELVYYGPNVSLGYAESVSDLSKGDENNGVLYTGDIARKDKEGYFYITGRMKRFVKVYGNRVNLDAIEQMLKPISLLSACVGIDDLITIFTPEIEKALEMRNHLSIKTGINVRAFSVRHISQIPKNSSGKIQYSDLMQLL